ncbi:hypothetical protein HYG77_38040 (plasmid) [Rhodococcus sp. ZPP]|uniref:hypothetical protein n=1 Tax=Rhodococcus sp. ZPP TaxID=2749906 RepID=UPI001AD891CC|nr:hypothetical protein [Rhodococcus sp. ZPP]QTJ71255.1 hypothetical protein HYG77_38040 [Rhodococcus sp. ZPP]
MFSTWVLQQASGGDLGAKVTAIAWIDEKTGLGPVLALVLTGLGLLGSVSQLIALLVREAVLAIVVGLAPVAAAQSATGTGRQSWATMMGFVVAALLFKPVASLFYVFAFWSSSSNVASAAVIGSVLLAVAGLSLPSLMAAVGPVGGGGGGGAQQAAAMAGATGAVLGSAAALGTRGGSGGVRAGGAGGGSTGGGGGGKGSPPPVRRRRTAADSAAGSRPVVVHRVPAAPQQRQVVPSAAWVPVSPELSAPAHERPRPRRERSAAALRSPAKRRAKARQQRTSLAALSATTTVTFRDKGSFTLFRHFFSFSESEFR